MAKKIETNMYHMITRLWEISIIGIFIILLYLFHYVCELDAGPKKFKNRSDTGTRKNYASAWINAENNNVS